MAVWAPFADAASAEVGKPELVEDINPHLLSSSPRGLTRVGESLFFTANDGIHGGELWRSDGTEAGTNLVADINAAYEICCELLVNPGSFPSSFTVVGEAAFFRADDKIHGDELWLSDGTAAGTKLVKDVFPGEPSGIDGETGVAVGQILFFIGGNQHGNSELWRSDGTEAGTQMVKEDVNPFEPSGSYRELTDVGGALFFAFEEEAVFGYELWRSDGTEAGTKMVKEIAPGDSAPPRSLTDVGSLTNVGDILFFSANDGVHGRELWRSDGTESGTQMVKDINAGEARSGPSMLAHIGDTLFFAADDGEHGYELWRSDGTEAGTKLVRDIEPGGASSWLADLTAVGDTLFFLAGNHVSNARLWRSDGTAVGTELVKDMPVGATSSFSAQLTDAGGGNLLFTADDGIHGSELWRSDGTESGTFLLGDIWPGPESADPSELVKVEDDVFFAAHDNVSGWELWEVHVFDVPPTAVDDEVTLVESSGTTTIDILANDTDTDGGPMEAVEVTQPVHGGAQISDGGFGLTYKADPGYCGPDSFVYELNGGSSATVFITVTCVDHSHISDAVESESVVATHGADDFTPCMAKARKAFHIHRKAAMKAHGKARTRAMKRASRHRHRAVSRCREGP